MTMQIPAQPNPGAEAESVPAKKAPAKKTVSKTGTKTGADKAPAKKAVPRTGTKKTAVAKTGARPAPVASVPADPEEWPPREWRETTRSAGHRQALYVTLSMLAMFGVLVGVAIWGSKNG